MSDPSDTHEIALLDRREFTLQFVLAVLSGATITVTSAWLAADRPPQSQSKQRVTDQRP